MIYKPDDMGGVDVTLMDCNFYPEHCFVGDMVEGDAVPSYSMDDVLGASDDIFG
jgi:hypothetical protein